MVSEKLTKKFGRGFSVDNLESMRSFYINYQNKFILNEASNSETLSRISSDEHNLLTLS